MPPVSDDRCQLVLILRLAILFHRNRMDGDFPQLALSWEQDGFQLLLEPDWLKNNPLTEAELTNEITYWKDIGISLDVH
jgi:exopolyphosphatase/guanosine-5'-triphosphate,3'-diphosphate pyrophosphatase